MTDLIRIEVVYALPTRQAVVKLRMPAQSTVLAAIEASGLLQKYPE
ncbi:MAG: RnfH family protein, partial [Rhodocyclaceae bacterium]|nr:RnfH family protein [Rhodocyclaceae bacterium]